MVLDRGSLKRESKALLKTAQVSPYLFTLVLLAIMFVINGISDYVQMDDEFAYVYSLRFDMDLSFLALHRAFPAFAVWFVSIVCTLLGVVLNVGASLYHLGIRRGEETALRHPVRWLRLRREDHSAVCRAGHLHLPVDAAAGDPRHRGGLPLPLCYAEPV